MVTVIGYTAERMKAIEDAAIVDGDIVGDNLILKRFDAGTIDAGNVRGPQGLPGPPGGPKGDKGDQGIQGIQGIQGLKGDAGGLDTATLNLLCPVGTIDIYGGAEAPPGWILCRGQSFLRETYPSLFNVIGTNFGAIDGLHFNVPNLQQRMPLGKNVDGTGSVLGSYGGSKDAQVITHNHNHAHGTWHAHDIGNDGNHNHIDASGVGLIWTIKVPGAQGNYIPAASKLLGGEGVTFTGVSAAGTHSHGGRTGIDATATGGDATNAGIDGIDQNLPAYVVVNYIIRY